MWREQSFFEVHRVTTASMDLWRPALRDILVCTAWTISSMGLLVLIKSPNSFVPPVLPMAQVLQSLSKV